MAPRRLESTVARLALEEYHSGQLLACRIGGQESLEPDGAWGPEKFIGTSRCSISRPFIRILFSFFSSTCSISIHVP